MKEYVVVSLSTLFVIGAVFHDVIKEEILSLIFSVDLSMAFYTGIAIMIFLGIVLFFRAVYLLVKSLLNDMETDIM